MDNPPKVVYLMMHTINFLFIHVMHKIQYIMAKINLGEAAM
jgi:hypothetical protein